MSEGVGFLYFGTGKMVPWSFSLKRHAVEMVPPAFLPPVPRKLEIEQSNDSFFFKLNQMSGFVSFAISLKIWSLINGHSEIVM